jgi:hypothetical protein
MFEYVFVIASVIIGLAITANERFHATFATLAVAYQSTWAVRMYETL